MRDRRSVCRFQLDGDSIGMAWLQYNAGLAALLSAAIICRRKRKARMFYGEFFDLFRQIHHQRHAGHITRPLE